MSSSPFDIYPTGNINANGAGGAIPVGNIEELMLEVTADNFTGTTPLLTVWLQSSADGSLTWRDCPYDLALEHAQTTGHTESQHFSPHLASAGTYGKERARNVFEQKNSTVSAIAKYHVFGSLVRLAWALSGTSPQCRLQAKAVGKG